MYAASLFVYLACVKPAASFGGRFVSDHTWWCRSDSLNTSVKMKPDSVPERARVCAALDLSVCNKKTRTPQSLHSDTHRRVFVVNSDLCWRLKWEVKAKCLPLPGIVSPVTTPRGPRWVQWQCSCNRLAYSLSLCIIIVVLVHSFYFFGGRDPAYTALCFDFIWSYFIFEWQQKAHYGIYKWVIIQIIKGNV